MSAPLMTADWTADDLDTFKRHCAWLKAHPLDVLGPMFVESGALATKRNPSSSATGLIQWMADKNGMYLGRYTRDEFCNLGVRGQLMHLVGYFAAHRGKLVSKAAVYVAIFLPAFVDEAHDPDYVLCADKCPLGWAFDANAAFLDANRDGRIQVKELDWAIERSFRGARAEELTARLGLQMPALIPHSEDLTTVLGVQSALAALGYNVTPDGVNGPLTAAALNQFRLTVGLGAGTTPGPLTQKALRKALDAR